MMPRLPVNNPRCGVAMMSPDGVTRFCSGIQEPDYSPQASLREALATKQSKTTVIPGRA
jgi:catalase